jgi:hypothetical protein
MYDWLTSGKQLTAPQSKYLESILHHYSKEAVADRKLWEEEYRQNHVLSARRVAYYYANNPPYFSDLVQNILTNPGFIPSKNQFNKFCKNKYAIKILQEYASEPKYKPGQMVQIRKTHRLRSANNSHVPGPSFARLAEKYAAVISVGEKPIDNARKGSKYYKILPVGGQALFAFESDLKKAKKRKS